MAADEAPEPALAKLRIVRPAGRGATDLALPPDTTIAGVKARIQAALDVPVASQRLIYGGKVLTDTQRLRDVLQATDAPQTVHLVVPQPAPAPAAPPMDLDASPELPAPAAPAPRTPPRRMMPPSPPITVSPAAQAYAEALRNSGFAAPSPPASATRQFINDARAALAAAAPPAEPEAPGLRALFWENEFLDYTLMLKLLAGVALLGQDASKGRIAALIGAAAGAYAVQTGLFDVAWGLMTATTTGPPAARAPHVRSAGEVIRASVDGTVHGPRDGGRLADAGLLLASFALSLAPPWRPRDHADVVLLRVRDSTRNQYVWFKVKATTKFGKVFRAFAARQAGQSADGAQRAWLFTLPGSDAPLSEDATAQALGLNPDSIIEARPAPPATAPPAEAPAAVA